MSSPSAAAIWSMLSSPKSGQTSSMDPEGDHEKTTEVTSGGDGDTASQSEEKVHIEKEPVKKQRPHQLDVTSGELMLWLNVCCFSIC